MNEQNIHNIIDYITQNPIQPQQILVQNLLTAGYPRIDIDEALTRMGLTPELMKEAEVLPVQPNNVPKKLSPILLKRLVLVAIAVILFGIGAYVWLQRPTPQTQTQTQTQTSTATITPTLKPIQFTDPTKPIHDKLESGSFKLIIDQRIFNTDPDLNEESVLTYYMERGSIQKFEHSSGLQLFIKNDQLYSINNQTKTYMVFTPEATQQERISDAFNKTNITYNLITNTNEGIYEWEQSEQSIWKGRNTQTFHTFNAEVDLITGLLQRVEEFDEENVAVSESIITIEPLPVIEDALVVPTGFTRLENTTNL